MSDKYNGWTNYATWRVNLEMFDGDMWAAFNTRADSYDLGNECREFAEDLIEHSSSGFARDYAMAFLQEVNWREIADHLIEIAKEESIC